MIDLNKEYGLVFSGGGARCAYEIGAWKAINELGIKVSAVVGTSGGALNGALFAMKDYQKGLDIWENMRYSSIINVEDDIIKKLTSFNWDEEVIKKGISGLSEFIFKRGLDITPLKQMINEVIDEKVLRSSGIDFGLTTISFNDFSPLELMLSDILEGQLGGYLLASSYLPLFRTEKIFGKYFLDGGLRNNTPANMLVERGYTDIIVVRVNNILDTERKFNKNGVNIIEITTTESMGGMLEFEKNKTTYNMALGYYDALRAFKDLKGNYYYIRNHDREVFFLKQFLKVKNRYIGKYINRNKIVRQAKNYSSRERMIFQELIPNLADKLGLGDKDSYQQIYIKAVEYLAKILEVKRFQEYSLNGLIRAIEIQYNHLETEELMEISREDTIFDYVYALIGGYDE